jgi:peptidoglycan/LPS O-acetylase OafA/YrhL
LLTRHRFSALDGIRGLAIIAVLLRHAAYVVPAHGPVTRFIDPFLQSGAWGVDLFFVLSGFLITGILIDTKAAVNRMRSFYGRRILRIFPVYFLAIGLVFWGEAHSALIHLLANLQNLADHAAYIFYFQNFIPLWHHGNYPESIIGPFWSLAVEEQFYLIWPVLIWHLAPKTVLKVCGAGLMGALVLRLILVPHFGSGIWVFASTFTRADGLFVGSALAAVIAVRRQIPKSLLVALAAGGTAILAMIALIGPARELWLTGPKMAMVGITGVALLGGALVGFCVQFQTGALARLFDVGWLRSFGKYSYGMYVWHFPIYCLAQAFLQRKLQVQFPLQLVYAFPYIGFLLALSYGVAWCSFNGYEQWFLRLKRYFEPSYTAMREPVVGPVIGSMAPLSNVVASAE